MRTSIKKGNDFRKVYASRKSYSSESLTVSYLKTDAPIARLGLSVSKKNGNAVVRNRIKRVFREAFWTSGMPVGYDFVMIPKPNIPVEFFAVKAELTKMKAMLKRMS